MPRDFPLLAAIRKDGRKQRLLFGETVGFFYLAWIMLGSDLTHW